MLRFLVIVTLIARSFQQDYNFKCGVRQFNQTGHATERSWNEAGDWPWHVAVLVQPEDGEGHICSGALISLQYVIATIDCVTNRNGEESWAKHTIVQVGSDVITSEEADKYQVHSIERFGNLALLKLYGIDHFTSYVQPICINQAASGKGKYGTVVGWDQESKMKSTRLELAGNDLCDKESGSDVICAKNQPDTCDFGEILYLRRGKTWFIGGLDSDTCGTHVPFNGLNKYLSWIRKITKLYYLEASDENCEPIDVEPQPFYYLLSTFPSSCGRYTVNKITGGHTANVFEFPWMAIVLYREDSTSQLSALCMGSLIHQRYVMTTAPCANGDPFKPTVVRLGEHTIDQQEDCNVNDEDDCAPPVQDFEVECSLGHQGYDHRTKRNNIGLIRLAKSVDFGDHIDPVCLPGTYDLARTAFSSYIVSGWGRNVTRHRQSSLQKAIVPSIDLQECQAKYEPFGLTLAEDQFCAGNSTGNSCYGDEGAPLGYTAGYYGKQQYVQFGITAFGTFGCKEFPAVYTNVSVHIGWIIGNIRP